MTMLGFLAMPPAAPWDISAIPLRKRRNLCSDLSTIRLAPSTPLQQGGNQKMGEIKEEGGKKKLTL
jgi:hypothetical protein